MSEDVICQFLQGSTEERFQIILCPHHTNVIRSYLGESAYAEYCTVADKAITKLSSRHLAADAPTNLVFIPGVMGSSLQSETLGGTWWFDFRALHRINDLSLDPNGLTDKNKDYHLIPGTTDISYDSFLGAALAREDFGHAIFPYDWRKSLFLTTNQLRNKIFSIFENNGNQKVHLVAHSMGGLLVRATLMQYGQDLWPKLGQIVFLGTPHYGSTAIASYLKNHLWGFNMMALLGLYLSPETFRSLHGVLSLLPAPRGVYPGTRESDSLPWRSESSDDPYIHPCTNFNMYQVDDWKLDLTDSQSQQLQHVLDEVCLFHEQMYSTHRRLSQDYCNRMAVIAGVGFKTCFRLAYDQRFWGLWKNTRKITERVENDIHLEGDGSVPLASAQLEYVGELRYVKGSHSSLPNIPIVYEDVFRWLNQEEMELPTSPAGALSRHLGDSDEMSEVPSLDGALRSQILDDENFTRWQLDESYLDELPQLKDRLEKGQLQEFMTIRLL